MSLEEKLDELLRGRDELLRGQAEQREALGKVSNEVLALSKRVTDVEGRASTSHASFSEADSAIVQLRESDKAEADRRHAQTMTKLAEVQVTGGIGPIARKLNVFGGAVLVFGAACALVIGKDLPAEQAYPLIGGLGVAYAGLVKALEERARHTERRKAATIPPPALNSRESA